MIAVSHSSEYMLHGSTLALLSSISTLLIFWFMEHLFMLNALFLLALSFSWLQVRKIKLVRSGVFMSIWCLSLSQDGMAAGDFQIQLVSYQNVAGELRSGQCCDGSRTIFGGRRRCRDPCETFFKVCLKQYEQAATASGRCTFGQFTTGVLGGNSFASQNETINVFSIHFKFSWLVSKKRLYSLYAIRLW